MSNRIRIPQENRAYSGIHDGDYLGNIYLTKNIDLQREQGKVVLSETLKNLKTSVQDEDLETPTGFTRSSADNTDRWWAACNKLFKTANDKADSAWSKDTIQNSPENCQDVFSFLNTLIVTTDDDVARLVDGSWEKEWFSNMSFGQKLQSGKPHPMHLFGGALLIGDGRFIHTWDGTLEESEALTLPSHLEITWIDSIADFAVIGTRSTSGQNAEIFFWNRTTDSFDSRYDVGSKETPAGFVVEGQPYVITRRGEIKQFTGQGFRTVQKFPTANKDQLIDMHFNGVSVEEDRILLNVSFGAREGEKNLSGIWEYDMGPRKNNLIHKYSFALDNDNRSQQEVFTTGAITTTEPFQGRFLVGVDPYTEYNTSNIACIQCSDEEDSEETSGYFITTKITAADVRAYFQRIHLKFRKFQEGDRSIRVFTRTEEDGSRPRYETVEFTDNNTFKGGDGEGEVGDVVEIIAGNNSGSIAVVQSKTADGSDFIYEIDSNLVSNSGNSRVRFLNEWKELEEVENDGKQESVMRVDETSGWIQVMVVLNGIPLSPQFEGLQITHDPKAR